MKTGPVATSEFLASSRSMVRTRAGLPVIGYGIFATVLFLALLTATFPYAETISSLLAPIGMKIVFERQAPNFPIGEELKNVQLISLADQRVLIQSPDVSIVPVMKRFLLGQLCLNVRAQIFGGMVDGMVRSRGQRGTILDFQLDALNLSRMGREASQAMLGAQGRESEESDATFDWGEILSGELSGRGSAQIIGSDLIAARASLILLGRDIKTILANGLPPLELGMVAGRVLLEQGVATLQNVRAYGRYGDLTANGEIHLGADMASSTLQLTLWLKPNATARASFGMLINLLPHSPGAGPYYLEGSLKFPVVS
ncbi:MAG: type II secretion system protein GspN [Deltaproteobacteria bacterium]|nr:type II secretion system protein GspN [Deltaproteobacteria bacterium]